VFEAIVHVQILAEKVQEVTGNSVEIAYVDQGYTGENAEPAVKLDFTFLAFLMLTLPKFVAAIARLL
jgi:hypothetical protein